MPIWKKTATEAFENERSGDIVDNNGLYDKLIIGYSFKKDLENYKFSKNEDRHEDFQPILTTRGMCYTFNSQILSDIWKPSKVTTAFIDMLPTEHVEKYFGGTGRVQGIFLTKIKRLVGHYYILL